MLKKLQAIRGRWVVGWMSEWEVDGCWRHEALGLGKEAFASVSCRQSLQVWHNKQPTLHQVCRVMKLVLVMFNIGKKPLVTRGDQSVNQPTNVCSVLAAALLSPQVGWLLAASHWPP